MQNDKLEWSDSENIVEPMPLQIVKKDCAIIYLAKMIHERCKDTHCEYISLEVSF